VLNFKVFLGDKYTFCTGTTSEGFIAPVFKNCHTAEKVFVDLFAIRLWDEPVLKLA